MTPDEREFEAHLHALEPAPIPASLKQALAQALHRSSPYRPVHPGIRWRTAAAVACVVGLAGVAAGRWSAGLGNEPSQPIGERADVPTATQDHSNRPVPADGYFAARKPSEVDQPYSLVALRSALNEDDLERQLQLSVEAQGTGRQAPLRVLDARYLMNAFKGADELLMP